MEVDKIKEYLTSLEQNERDKFTPLITIIEEINKNLSFEPSAYVHLMLREKYFFLFQTIIESNNDLILKYVFNSLQNFFFNESKCESCSIKEKSQFLLNILRYIQHTHLNNEITKMEIFKFLLNNHEIIEPLLNSKILYSLIEISINEYQCENKFVQNSSKALIIKYIAVICNQISSFPKSQDKQSIESIEAKQALIDSFIVSTFSNLLNIFNQHNRTFELRNLILECIELLLNNLIAEKQKSYDIRKNKQFIEFAWQEFCPSILFQFGDCGLPNKTSTLQSLNFKQIYTILIQLTGLIGGNKALIPVFEAIYQRILLFPPEQDNHFLLKLFKTYVDRDFIISLTVIDPSCRNENENEQIDESKKLFNEFTLINLIIGYYRNCYEHSMKTPNDKILQLLSCECINSFVKLIYNLYEENLNETVKLDYDESFNFVIDTSKNLNYLNTDSSWTKQDAKLFVDKLYNWLNNLYDDKVVKLDLDFKIKQFCLNLMKETNTEYNSAYKFIYSNSNRLQATVYLSLYVLFKSFNDINKKLDLTNVVFSQSNNNSKEFFIYRVLMYQCDLDCSTSSIKSSSYFKEWLSNVYEGLIDLSNNKKDFLLNFILIEEKNLYQQQMIFILKQMDCVTKIKITKKTTSSNDINIGFDLVKKLLKCSWIYLIDVLVGFLLNSNIDSLESVLFNDIQNTQDENLENNSNTDFSFKIFAFKSTLDSLFYLVKILSSLNGLDKELNQIFLLLIENNFFKNNVLESNPSEVNLNKIICLDFSFYITCELVCNFESNNSKLALTNIAKETLWKYLIETAFFCLNFQANLDYNNLNNDFSLKQNSEAKNLKNFFFNKKQKLFRSVYSNLSEINNQNEGHIRSNRFKSVDLINERLEQTDLIIRNIFLFLNKQNYKNYLKLNKYELIDSISNYIYNLLFNQLLNSTLDDKVYLFDYIWQFSSNLCLFSKRFLIDENNLRKQNEYFSFNYLIIDKIEEFLINIISRLKTDITIQDISYQISLPNSLISIFFTDLWLFIFMKYFQKIFSKFGHALKLTKVKNEINKTNKTFNVFSNVNKIKSSSNSNKPDSDNTYKIDLSICKKLIFIIQKLFEIYNQKSIIDQNMNYLELVKNKLNFKQEQDNLIQTPSTSSCSAVSTPNDNFNDHDFTEPNDLIAKLESYKNNLNKQTNRSDFFIRLLHSTTASILMPNVNLNNDLIEFYLIDENFNLNSLILLPFKKLMLKTNLNYNLKDSVITSFSEIVEDSSFKIKNSWDIIFFSLSLIDYNEKINKAKNKKSRVKTRLNHDQKLNSVDSVESSTSINSYNSSRSSSSSSKSNMSEISLSNESSRSSSCSSTRSLSPSNSSYSLTFYTLPIRNDNHRVRLNLLIDIFNIFLSQASTSVYITANGVYDFLKCISIYLQYKTKASTEFDIENFIDKENSNQRDLNLNIDECVENENLKEKCDQIKDEENDEDLFLSANDYQIQERHYQLTSNYQHLCELSNSNESNTQIKPFLLCIEKAFNILLKIKKEDSLTSLNDISFIQIRDFELNKIRPIKSHSFELTLKEFIDLYSLDEKSLNFLKNNVNIENNNNLRILNDFYDSYFLNDKRNYSKILIFLIKSMSNRIILAPNEINCVQIVQLIYELTNRLVISNDFILVGYLILEILIPDLNLLIDLVEFKNKYSSSKNKSQTRINHKLLSNTFFMSNLITKIIEKLILISTKFINESKQNNLNENFNLTLLNCLIGRIIYIISNCLIKKLINFCSIIDLNIITYLKNFYLACFDLNNDLIRDKCINSIELFHLISLIPFETLIKYYGPCKDEEKKMAQNSDEIEIQPEYSNLEIMTQKCKSAWELYNVKKGFNMAKSFLNYEKTSLVDEKLYNNEPSQSIQDLIKLNESNLLDDELLNESISNNELDCDENCGDDTNFYRVFTLKFNLVDLNMISKRYLFLETINTKKVNLTCFINSYKFHIDLINLIKLLISRLNLENNFKILYKFLKFFNLTYLKSLRLEHNLSIKILLSKIFYLNYENCLGNFINITKSSFLMINYLYFKYDLLNYLIPDLVNDDSNEKYESFDMILNEQDFSHLSDKIELKISSLFDESDLKENFFQNYFFYFFIYFCKFYVDLNEKCHDFKLEKSFFKNLLEKLQKEESVQSEDFFLKEILEMLQKHKEQNKLLTMKSLTKMTESAIIKTNEENDSKYTNSNSNDSVYLQKDSLFRYQIWSNEMIPYFLLHLSKQTLYESDEKLYVTKIFHLFKKNENYSVKTFLINLAELIVVFNSCSSYCKCIENEANLKFDIKKVKEISSKLLSIILYKYRENMKHL